MAPEADKDAAMPVNFDFNDLYAFRALMEYGSFRLAAESICLSQSALSRRIESWRRRWATGCSIAPPGG
ncbi:hypothetical protein KPZU09_04210 [Klebsiella pneumoniae]|uniref:HTH lysR-type domain-containing protein n=2 Tax=Klebsiella pneumoniae TaxID=573 RepID=A0A919HN91_KLEPN|nr:hypothetical protein KPZU09_04210 [Klebsiella pneumoniae]